MSPHQEKAQFPQPSVANPTYHDEGPEIPRGPQGPQGPQFSQGADINAGQAYRDQCQFSFCVLF